MHPVRAVLETAANTVPPTTVTDALIRPPLGACVFHNRAPVSALRAKIHPPLDPANTQPSATAGVPVKSPAPPALLAENVHAGARVGTSAGAMARS